MELPAETTTGASFLETYATALLAMQVRVRVRVRARVRVRVMVRVSSP